MKALCNAHSMQWYLVGGAVRDILLGQNPDEADLAFSGTAEDMLLAYPEARKVGRSVKVCLLHGRECMPLHGGSISSDLHARDLTINALALDADGMLHAHPQAVHDLARGILRPASPTAFADDPTRIYRMARFAAQFPAFTVHEEALAQARAVLQSSAHRALPAERVGRELQKALACARPSRFVAVLARCDGLKYWFKELEGADMVPAGPLPWHDDSVLEHTATVMDRVAGSALAVWMALCHDLGKIGTPRDMLPHHYGHELRGMEAARALASRLALPARWLSAGMLAAQEHMKGGMYAQLRTGTRRDLLHKIHTAGLHDPFWALVDADSGKSLSPQAGEHLQALLAVRLPEHWRNRGAESGQHLRLLQCNALSALK